MTAPDMVEFVRAQLVQTGVDADVGVDDDVFDAGFDSMGLVVLLTAFEATFGTTIDESLVVPRNFQTIRLIATLLEGVRTGESPGAAQAPAGAPPGPL